MIKKFFAILIICSISFFAGSYYTMNNSPSKFLDWNKESIFQDGVELISILPQNLEVVFDDIKIFISDSIDFVDEKIGNLLNKEKDDIKSDIVENQNDYKNPLFEPTEDLQQANLDYDFYENTIINTIAENYLSKSQEILSEDE
ncbi:hypothetical protein [Viridibacillus arvi]|uniref:hypothetical protein n=1 Tax=Viridibacillus arvi TaxID=263475 RepID=UPI00187BB4C0|nr:hypothetical protein [Viridibacillus sp. JNUCC-6]QOV10479.1 hypothetical protein JNUCC6_18135 [Viridibacillus sp. JNUCC-6]